MLVPLIAVLDWMAGPSVRMTLLYLLVLLRTSWLSNRAVGIGAALFVGAISFVAQTTEDGWTDSFAVLAWNATMIIGSFWMVAALVDSLHQALSKEKDAANTDPISGLLNARGFQRSARVEMNRARRYDRPLTVAFMDLDRFKEVNDKFGHQTGDEVLRQVARVLNRTLREQDVVARVGGDEFAVLMPETDLRQAEAALHRLRYHLLDRMERYAWPVTFSIGAAVFRTVPDSVQELLDRADAIQYRAKHDGKDRIYCELAAEPSSPTIDAAVVSMLE